MNVQDVIKKSIELDRNFDARLSLLRDLSYRILDDDKNIYSFDDIIRFLKEVWSAEVEAENAYRMVMTNRQGEISDEMNKNCYQIIKKYKISDLDILGYFTRAMMYVEKDPKKWAELQREEDEIDDMKIALWERRKKI